MAKRKPPITAEQINARTTHDIRIRLARRGDRRLSEEENRKILFKLLRLSRADIAALVATRSEITPEMAKLIIDESQRSFDEARINLARNPVVPRRLILRLLAHRNDDVVAIAATHPSLRRNELKRLLDDGDAHVRIDMAIAMRPDLPKSLVRKASKHADASIRAAVARRPGLPASIVETLADDADPNVKASILFRQDVSDRILLRISRNPINAKDGTIHALAARNSLPTRAIEIMAESDDLDARRRIAARKSPIPSKAIVKLSNDDNIGIRLSIAMRPECPNGVLRKLARDPEELVRRRIVSRPVVDDDVLLICLALEDESPDGKNAIGGAKRKLLENRTAHERLSIRETIEKMKADGTLAEDEATRVIERSS